MISRQIHLMLICVGDSNVLPEVSSFTGTVLHNISEVVSNPSIGFSNSSLRAVAIDGNF